MFHLSECNEPIDGHEIIFALYNIGECDQAVELAERFRVGESYCLVVFFYFFEAVFSGFQSTGKGVP